MFGTCILTDSTVQFLNPAYQNHEHILVLHHHLSLENGQLYEPRDAQTWTQIAAENSGAMHLVAPTVDEFRQAIIQQSQKYQTVIAVLVSSHLSDAYKNASEAIYQVKGPANVQLIDSQTTGAGLGLLVQAASDAAQRGMSPIHINRMVRGMIPHIYTVFCLQSLHNLAYAGQLDPAQAVVGEMLGVIPFYVMDGGKLVPIQKARSSRQLVDVLHEFVSEFDRIKNIAILHSVSLYEQEIRNLRDRLTQNFPGVPISEHTFGPALLTLLGPRSLGVVVLERNEEG